MAAGRFSFMSRNAVVMLFLISSSDTERCPFESSYTNHLFTLPPPEFPDFMTIFAGTIYQIGLLSSHSPSDEHQTLSNACPKSVNWTEFNSRLCGSDPFDLEGFCTSTSTSETTIPPGAVQSSSDIDIISQAPDTTQLPPDIPITSVNSNRSKFSLSKSFPASTEESYKSHITNSIKSIHLDTMSILDSATPYLELPTPNGSDSSEVSPSSINYSTAITSDIHQGDGISVAIGLGCGFSLLFIIISVAILFISQTSGRNRELRQMVEPLFKVFQRQTSDVRSFSMSASSQPSTPLEDIYPDGIYFNNNAEAKRKHEWKNSGNV